jgi:hypothetical protein
MAGTKRKKGRQVGKFIEVDKKFLQEAAAITELVLARIGDTPAKRLAWLLKFMNTDLTLLREQERVALGYDLQSLWLGVDEPKVTPSVGYGTHRMDRSELSDIQKWVKDGFATLFSDKSNRWSYPAPVGIRLVRQSPLDAKRSDLRLVTFLPAREGLRQSIELAILHIVFAGKNLLRACSECKSPFVPVRRQEYCSVKCSQKARDRRRKK